MNYRQDIDGLRAIAVAAVVLFHLGVPGFSGGYVGVDVFFVISGYLISSLIKDKIETDRFQLLNFYYRRVRRLLPPLIVTVAGTLFAAAFVLTPDDMIALGRSAVAAVFSLSNFVFYSEAGYWDTVSELKPLLHTWSLGVEEQFYLFWPALLLLLLRPAIRTFYWAGLSLLALASATLCIWYTAVDQSAAFYLLPFRVFQFALGALVAPLSGFFVRRDYQLLGSLRNTFFLLGMCAILYSILLFGPDTLFPGWPVLVPTLGTCLVLLAGSAPGERGRLAHLLMENRLSVWLGVVSYSMYLVHWPVIALYRYRNGVELGAGDQVSLAAITLLGTLALHYGVERRFYRRAGVLVGKAVPLPGAAFARRTLLAALLVAAPAIMAWLGDGWSWRFPDLTLSPAEIENSMESRYARLATACRIENATDESPCDNSAKIDVMVIGNSHATDGFNFVSAGWKDRSSLNMIMFGDMISCKDLVFKEGQFMTNSRGCQQKLDGLFRPERLASLDIIVYSSNRPFFDGPTQQRQTLDIIGEAKRRNPQLKVITIGGYINTSVPCARLINETGSTDACAQRANVSYFAGDPGMRELYDQVESLTDFYIDRVELLCTDGVVESCKTRTDDGIPAFYDQHHLSLEFSEWSGMLYAERHRTIMEDLVGKKAR